LTASGPRALAAAFDPGANEFGLARGFDNAVASAFGLPALGPGSVVDSACYARAMSNTCALRSLPAYFRRSKNPPKPSTRFAEDPKNQ